MVRFRARVRRRALDRIQAIELRTIAFDATAGRERARVFQAVVPGAEKIGVERQDDVGAIHGVLGIDVFAERQPAALARVVTAEWLPLHPLRPREPAEELLRLRAKRR